MISSTIKEYREIRANLHALLDGVVLSVDPSCGSMSSMPGWAVSRAGELVDSGTILLPVGEELWVRLQALHHGLRKLIREFSPDVMVFEDIAPRRYGGGSAHSHSSLLKAVGVTLSVSGPSAYIGLRPPIWSKAKRSSYTKGDRADAIEMLYVAISSAAYIAEEDPPRSYKKTTRRARTKAGEILYVRNENESEGAITGSKKQTVRRRRTPRRLTATEVPPF